MTDCGRASDHVSSAQKYFHVLTLAYTCLEQLRCLFLCLEGGLVDEDTCKLNCRIALLATAPQTVVPLAKKRRFEMTAMQVLGFATHASSTSQPWPAKGGPAMCPTKESAVGPWRRWLVGTCGLGKVSATAQSIRHLERG